MPPLLGERAISRFRCHLVLAAAAPLVLGGCGLPIGIQIASLFADGVSFLATDKTLSDHGISMVAGKDCALWRIVKGEDVCREIAPDDILVADATEIAAFPDGADETDDFEAVPALSDDVLIAEANGSIGPAGEADPGGTPEFLPVALEPELEVAELSTLETAAGSDVPADAGAAESPVDIVAVIEPAPPAAKMRAAVAAAEVPVIDTEAAVIEDAGGTFLIIASYFRSGDAEHFARDQEGLDTKVISGTAKGRKVYRVAVGPLTSTDHKRVKADLLRAGFRDVWALRLRQPDVVVQVAALD